MIKNAVLLTGNPGVGKTTIAQYLEKHYGGLYYEVDLAKPLTALLTDWQGQPLAGFNKDSPALPALHSHHRYKVGDANRDVMGYVGQAVEKATSPACWIGIALAEHVLKRPARSVPVFTNVYHAEGFALLKHVTMCLTALKVERDTQLHCKVRLLDWAEALPVLDNSRTVSDAARFVHFMVFGPS